MKSCVHSWKSVSWTLLFWCVLLGTQAQVASLSPYSRFALGELQSPGTTAQRGFGGITAVDANRFSVNGYNPASYSYLFRTAYNLDIRATRLNVDDGNEQVDLYGGTLNSAQFGFKRQGSKWGFGLGLRPYSSLGYDIAIEEDLEDIGDVTYTYTGDGGLNQAHAGLSRAFAVKAKTGLLQHAAEGDTLTPMHTVSIGVNLDYLFGQLATVRRVLYSGSGFYDTRIQNNTNVQTVSATAGLLAQLRLKTSSKSLGRTTDLLVGATYSIERDAQVTYSTLNESIYSTGGSEFVTDTAAYQPNTNGVMSVPASLTAGIGLTHRDSKDRTWTAATDIKLQDWSTFSTDFDLLSEVTELQQSQELSFGIAVTPRPLTDNTGAVQRGTYRLGFRTADSYITVRDNPISEWAVSGGLTLPISNSNSTSMFHFGIEFGARGTTANNLIQENFIHTFAGFSFSPVRSNQWFVERKYD